MANICYECVVKQARAPRTSVLSEALTCCKRLPKLCPSMVRAARLLQNYTHPSLPKWQTAQLGTGGGLMRMHLYHPVVAEELWSREGLLACTSVAPGLMMAMKVPWNSLLP